ncbi:glycosyltransferase family 2 protein [Methanobacterium subterraneum]|uniref:Glycosyltransferase n=1 Tax=Methanobacterium subterraneum TaxID=59277 RepID=A0A7K4DM44_9EURY|nr:glycosyltransferase [Methanobacterium subterraneum]NMO09460.1 glycosyltransferase [Methanobacterium subterraneum]
MFYLFESRAYIKTRMVWKKLINGYYYQVFDERKKNKDILKKNREKYKRDEKPLISVLIPTYNRAKLLTERTIPSVLGQTYQKFEIIIVGDHCSDNTEELVKNFKDKRIKFYNLPERGNYPKNPRDRWCVAGTFPANKAIELCSGDWIAPLDDDDEFSEDHLETLLKFALENNYEMVYGKVEMEDQWGNWIELGSYPPKWGKISRMAALYNSNLKFFTYDIKSWKYGEPADWNMWRRMKEAGVRMGFLDKVVGKHYKERQRRE